MQRLGALMTDLAVGRLPGEDPAAHPRTTWCHVTGGTFVGSGKSDGSTRDFIRKEVKR